jgi:hypothetical protein
MSKNCDYIAQDKKQGEKKRRGRINMFLFMCNEYFDIMILICCS